MADTYNVRIKAVSDSTWGPWITGLTSPNYTFTGLKPSTTYQVEVIVVGPNGNQSSPTYSTFTTASPPAPPPAPPPVPVPPSNPPTPPSSPPPSPPPAPPGVVPPSPPPVVPPPINPPPSPPGVVPPPAPPPTPPGNPPPAPPPASPSPALARVVAPLTGTVARGNWVTNQSIACAAMPNGYMRYNYLLPQGYDPNGTILYPVLFYGHENDEGMSGSSYPSDGAALVNQTVIDGTFNTVAFRTNFPCIVVVPHCDQSIDLSGGNGNANFGGYADTPNSGGNEQGINLLLEFFLANFRADYTRCYCTGDSLGAIGTLAWLVDNNAYNGSNRLWAAGMGFSDQLYRPSVGSNTGAFQAMTNVPYIAISTPNDNNQDIYDAAAWQYYTGNTNYPSTTSYANGGISACRAGTSSFYYIRMTDSTMPWDVYRQLNADGGQGTGLYNLLFSFASGSLVSNTPAPPPSTPYAGESADGATVTGTSGTIIDSTGRAFALVSGSNGYSVALNGVTLSYTQNVTMLYYKGHRVYAQDNAGWLIWYGGDFVATSDPRSGVSPPTPVPAPPAAPPPSPPPSITLRNWYDAPGMDDSYWVRPLQTTAQWDTSSNLVHILRNGNNGSPTGYVHIDVTSDFVVPVWRGTANDPLVKVTDNTKTIYVHIPIGATNEKPNTGTDNCMAGMDLTQPYLFWTANNSSINTGSVTGTNTVITCGNLAIDDASGPIMTDAVTGQPGTGNAFGIIQDWELTAANNDPNYVIPHMLAYSLDPSQCTSGGPIWPLKIIDTSFPNTGGLDQGYTVGIPYNTPRPAGKSRGFNLLFDTFQRMGAIFYNVSGNGCISLGCYHTSASNAALAQDLQNSFSDVVQYLCLLTNQTDPQSCKGWAPGGVPAYPPPAPLDLSPTGGKNVKPDTFGAFYPSGYDVTPTNTPYSASAPSPSTGTPTPPAPPSPPAPAGTGEFVIRNGLIYDPNGNRYLARGINIYEFDLGSAISGGGTAPLTTLFPGVNFIRVPCYTYNDPTYYQAFINAVTPLGIVVELEHHVNAGGGIAPLTGSDLNAENNWFANLASFYKNNPYVWFGTLNEPSGPGDQLTAEQVSNYNAIRGAGCPNPIMMEILGDYATGTYTLGAGHGLIASSYTGMTNIIWDMHYYNWLTNYSADVTTNLNMLNTLAGQAQTITSADGKVPVLIGEYGNSTTGSSNDAGGMATVQAVQQSVGAASQGCAAWQWEPNNGGLDGLQDGNGGLSSPYGQAVASWIKSTAVSSTSPSPPAAPPPAVSATYITPGNGSFADSAGNVYTIDSAKNFTVNGTAVNDGAGTGAAELYSGVVYAQDANTGQWYTYDPSSQKFTASSAPPIPSSPSPPSPAQVASAWSTPPSQAQAAGFTHLVFFDDFTSNTIAPSMNTASGYNWYWNYGTTTGADFVLHTTANAASISNGNSGGGANASPNGGIVTITNSAQWSGLITVPGGALNNSAATMPSFGNWQHCYVEAYLQCGMTNPPNAGQTWPAFWSWAVEGLKNYGFGGSALTASNYVEIDFLETYGTLFGNQPGGFTTTCHQWPANNSVGGYTTNITRIDANWHTYGMLWQSTGSGTGSLQFYLDNQLLNFNGTTTFQTGTNQTLFSLESQHLFLIVSSGVGWPMNCDWVRVWQN